MDDATAGPLDSDGLEAHDSGCRLPPGYRHLLNRAIDVFISDERVRAAWVHGSIARGDADEVSDLDVIVAVADADLTSFARGWRERVDAITPTVMARPAFGVTGSWLAITPTCQRFDLWVEPVSQTSTSSVVDRLVLFDRDDLARSVPAPPSPATPSAERRGDLYQRFVAAASVARVADELLMLQVVWTLRLILYDALVESNRPLAPTGLKKWSAKLTDSQRAELTSLPSSGDPRAVVAALESELGTLPSRLPDPKLESVVVPPEGVIRGLDVTSVPPGTWSRHVTEEYFALHLYLTVILHRHDWLLGVVGANDPRKLLYELALEENGRRPARSPADWSDRLTTAQRRELLAMPSGEATRSGVLDAHLASREIFTRVARAIVGRDWPVDLRVGRDGARGPGTCDRSSRSAPETRETYVVRPTGHETPVPPRPQ